MWKAGFLLVLSLSTSKAGNSSVVTYDIVLLKGVLTSVELLEPLCCKAFSGTTTPRQQHWAVSVQKQPSNHSMVIGRWLPNR